MTTPRLALCAWLLAWATACPNAPAPTIVLPPPPPEPTVMDHWTMAPTADAGAGHLGARPLGRLTRRLSVDQLDRSIAALTAAGWKVPLEIKSVGEDGGNATVPVDLLGFLGPSLGRADYLGEYRESNDVSATFTKLMDNWASESCVAMVLADDAEPNQDKRKMVVGVPDASVPDAGPSPARRAIVLENLRRARLHFQSIYTAPTDVEAQLGPLADTFEKAARRFRDAYPPHVADYAAWGAVCTLLLTDPEFVTY